MKTIHRRHKKTGYCLGDLVAAIGSCSHNKRESLAAIVDLLDSGKVKFLCQGRPQRVRVGT